MDLGFDGVGGRIGTQAAALLVEHGRLSAYGMAGGPLTTLDEDAQRRGVRTAPLGTPGAPEARATTGKTLLMPQ